MVSKMMTRWMGHPLWMRWTVIAVVAANVAVGAITVLLGDMPLFQILSTLIMLTMVFGSDYSEQVKVIHITISREMFYAMVLGLIVLLMGITYWAMLAR